jgi:hypothetical protein
VRIALVAAFVAATLLLGLAPGGAAGAARGGAGWGGRELVAPVRQETIENALRAHMLAFLGQVNAHCFGRAVSLGNVELFDRAIGAVSIVIDPSQGNVQGLHEPSASIIPGLPSVYSNRLTLLHDPRNVPERQLVPFRTTVWHELTHELEVQNGAESDPRRPPEAEDARRKDFDERHTVYREEIG